MPEEVRLDPETEWLDHVRPVGLVFAPSVLKESHLTPERQTAIDSDQVKALLHDEGGAQLGEDPWPFFAEILGWPARRVFGVEDQPKCPAEFSLSLPDQGAALVPTWAVRKAGDEPGVQLLVLVEHGVDLDARRALEGWEASAQQRFERLLRETGVEAGVLVGDQEIRLVHAPKGEASGWISWPIASLATVAGRPMLAGLKLALGAFALFNRPEETRLTALLTRSRQAQTSVSTKLAEQVLGALHELLRAFDSAEGESVRRLARTSAGSLYEGLLTVLMRLIFVLYAEDRNLLPSTVDGPMRRLYDDHYSVRALLAQLRADAAIYADTMFERVGAWGRLLALFRLIHEGHASKWIQARGGKLFDPDAFPFLEGREAPSEAPRVAAISDGAVLRVLENLMVLDGQRLSYRALDVEQIGSVYETVIGFTIHVATGPTLAIKAGKHNKVPVFVDLAHVQALAPDARLKALKEEYSRASLTAKQQAAVKVATDLDGLAAALDGLVDERGSPGKRIAAAGTPFLQPTDERRRTGSHYTPRSLTEPIVRHALEPAFERLGETARPEDVLALKICDPAMGSGAFLVEACRALATRLIQAWAMHQETRPVIPADEDEDLHARRLVAQRCLYGVDKNPMATDLARLSLWLATLAKDHEFTFLDHALKTGDSLVGLTIKQIAACRWDDDKPSHALIRQIVESKVAEVLAARRRIAEAPDDVSRETQEALHCEIEEKLDLVRHMGDAIVAAFFRGKTKKEREGFRAELEQPFAALDVQGLASAAKWTSWFENQAHPFRPFHWELEFPEVFDRENGGFDAVVSNPPFMGSAALGQALGSRYTEFLRAMTPSTEGKCDLAVFFVRRIFAMVRNGGAIGCVVTKSITEGDSRRCSLRWIAVHGGEIFGATSETTWPGDASVVIRSCWIARGVVPGSVYNDAPSLRLSTRLEPGGLEAEPSRLKSNEGLGQRGAMIQGDGFVLASVDDVARLFDEAETSALVTRGLLFPWTTGDLFTNASTPEPKEWLIDVNDYTAQSVEELFSEFPRLREHIVGTVLREREELSDSAQNSKLIEQWWRHARRSDTVRSTTLSGDAHILVPRVSKYLVAFRVEYKHVPNDKVCVFALSSNAAFACLQSRVHEIWTRKLSGSTGETLTYSPTEVSYTFPLPEIPSTAESEIELAGRAYHAHRAAIMVELKEGATQIYNRFHDRTDRSEAIVSLRALHSRMDTAVLGAYGWNDLVHEAHAEWLDQRNETNPKYHERSFWRAATREEVLARLLALNSVRSEEEAAAGAVEG